MESRETRTTKEEEVMLGKDMFERTHNGKWKIC